MREFGKFDHLWLGFDKPPKDLRYWRGLVAECNNTGIVRSKDRAGKYFRCRRELTSALELVYRYVGFFFGEFAP